MFLLVFLMKYPSQILLKLKNYRYINSYDLINEINENPNIFTPWFKICIDRVLKLKSIFEKKVLIA